jgi:hypothetical protein
MALAVDVIPEPNEEAAILLHPSFGGQAAGGAPLSTMREVPEKAISAKAKARAARVISFLPFSDSFFFNSFDHLHHLASCERRPLGDNIF